MDIRNFCIIAHIDHGKSTLADRLLELTDSVRKVDKGQMLDTMDLEQERGITIKLTPARMSWKGVELNLIDTPWHADFQYEVSRSLAAVEGAVLLVDASQGIQAQTLSTLYMAMEHNLTIIPVLNKIDLPAADPERVTKELEQTIGIEPDEVISVSAKTGDNVDKVLDAIIERIPNPQQYEAENDVYGKAPENAVRALIFDSVYDQYMGVVSYIKVLNGTIKAWDTLNLIHSQSQIKPTEVWFLTPAYHKDKALTAGQIGYVVTGEKSVRDAQIGDTMIDYRSVRDHEPETWIDFAIPGFQKAKAYVFAWVYPLESSDYDQLKEAFAKLTLNDSAVSFEPEVSKALWFGFRCGFLGMLHMDIIKERLSREFDLETIFTTPTVRYLVRGKKFTSEKYTIGTNVMELVKSNMYKFIISDFTGKLSSKHEDYIANHTDREVSDFFEKDLKPWIMVQSGADMIEKWDTDAIYEPRAHVEVVGPETYTWRIMELCQDYRWSLESMEYLDETRVVWRYTMPMWEIIIDFYDKLKSATQWYATMNYEFKKYGSSDLVKMDILINGERIEAFSMILHKDKAYYVWQDILVKLKELIPRHMFPVPLQAALGTKIIARETIPAMRKDVIAKCYGWDVSRKKKLLKKQKEGKKRMKAMGNVNVPSDIFIKMVSQ